MKPSTPRKPRRRNQPTSGPAAGGGAANAVPASDYESDAGTSFHPSTFQDPAQSTAGGRTIGDMNLGVLKRHLPTVESYISMSHNTSVYEWDNDNDTWGQAAYKGPLFVCDLHPDVDTDTGQRVPRACIFVINRQSMDNLVLNLANVSVCRQNDDVNQLIELSAVGPSGESVNWGLFIDQDSLAGTWPAIQERWTAVRKTGY